MAWEFMASVLIVFTIVFAIVSALVWKHYSGRSRPESERYQTFAPRFWAAPVDGSVLWPVILFITYLYTRELAPATEALLFLLANSLLSVYTIVLHALCGQTVGKMICKVRVVDFKTEAPISVKQAIVRDGIPLFVTLIGVAYATADILHGANPLDAMRDDAISENRLYQVLSVIPAVWFGLEVLTMLTNDKRRALHDLIAGTVVVRTNIFRIDDPTVWHATGHQIQPRTPT